MSSTNKNRRRRKATACSDMPGLELLEDRKLLTAGNASFYHSDWNDQLNEAQEVSFSDNGSALYTGSISDELDVDMLWLNAGEHLFIDLDVPESQSLNSHLRLFDGAGQQIASGNGGLAPDDATTLHELVHGSYLQFQIPKDGKYYIGISSQDNQDYSPFTGWWDEPGSTGDYSLTVIKRDEQDSIDAPVLNVPAGQLNIGGTITWDAVHSATRYDVWIVGSSGSLRYDGLTSASWKIPASFANGDYSVRIRAWSGSVVSEWGSAVNASVRVTAPSRVSIDSVSSGASAEIRWGSVNEAETYNVYIESERTGQVIRDTTQGTSFQLSPNMNTGRYSVWVQAVNRVGRGVWSQEFVFHIGSQLPGRVEQLLVSTSTVRPIITWRDASQAVTYDVYIRNQATGEVFRDANVAGTRFQPPNDLVYGTYQVWVRARNSAGTGGWSNSLTFKIDMTAPETPTGLRVTTSAADSTPTLDWNAADRTQMYELYIRNRVTGAVMRDTAVSYTDYTFTQPLENGTYQVWIRATNSSGASPWTRPIEMIVNSPNAVSFGQNPIAGSAELDLRFSWMQVAGAKSYEYQIVRLGNLRPDVQVESSVTQNTNFAFKLPDMTSGVHQYRISVRAITDNGATLWRSQIVNHTFRSHGLRDRYGRIVITRTITISLGQP